MTTPWRATFTRRWHANPDLCHTVDPVGYHSGRMGVLALQCFGETASRDLLVACLCHDLGESSIGDLPIDAKADPVLSGMLDVLEGRALHRMGMGFEVSEADYRRMKYLDRLDALLWAEHHAPHLMKRPDWVAAQDWLNSEWAEVRP